MVCSTKTDEQTMNKLTILDAIPTARLMSELGAKRTRFYKAIAQLNIQTFMDGKTSMVRSEDAQKLRDHYQQKTVELNGEPIRTITLSELENRQTDKRTNEIIPLLQALSAFLPQSKPDPFANQRYLQEACDQGWRLSTRQVAQLVERSPKTLGSLVYVKRYGFRIESMGYGRSREWKISKTEG
jgi:hypothetical protein